jgi:hypothetical protein
MFHRFHILIESIRAFSCAAITATSWLVFDKMGGINLYPHFYQPKSFNSYVLITHT